MADKDYTLILSHLEKLEGKIDGLASELQQTNIEMTRIAGMKHALNDLKAWKENMDSIVNADDLRDIKKTIKDLKIAVETIEDFEDEVKSLKASKEEDRKEIYKLKTFKTKAVTIGSVLFFLLTAALTVVGWFLS